MTSRYPRQSYSPQAPRRCKGHVIWPTPAEGPVTISPAQLVNMLEGIDWRAPQKTYRPEIAG
jgi:transposase